jgi:hypothetical protein
MCPILGGISLEANTVTAMCVYIYGHQNALAVFSGDFHSIPQFSPGKRQD